MSLLLQAFFTRSPLVHDVFPNEHGNGMSTATTTRGNLESLVAIAYAAHKNGDRELERAARRELQERHQVALRFIRRGQEAAR